MEEQILFADSFLGDTNLGGGGGGGRARKIQKATSTQEVLPVSESTHPMKPEL